MQFLEAMLRQTTPRVIARKKDPEICAFSSVPFCVRSLGLLKKCGMSHLNETTENRCIPRKQTLQYGQQRWSHVQTQNLKHWPLYLSFDCQRTGVMTVHCDVRVQFQLRLLLTKTSKSLTLSNQKKNILLLNSQLKLLSTVVPC